MNNAENIGYISGLMHSGDDKGNRSVGFFTLHSMAVNWAWNVTGS